MAKPLGVMMFVVGVVGLGMLCAGCGGGAGRLDVKGPGVEGGAGAPETAERCGDDVGNRHTTAAFPAAAQATGLENLLEVSEGVWSGGAPYTDAQFDALAELGVRTVISVDGGRPLVEKARARGMRYVHLPTTYSGIPRARQLELARALRDLPRPAYVHCHHGMHRGPAAVASAAVVLDWMTPEEGVAFLRRAGTSGSYPGLFASVRGASAASERALAGASAAFPEMAPVPDFITAMVETELIMTHLKAIEAAGWRTPAEHPDLVPAAEAGRLADLLRDMRQDEYVEQNGSGEFVYFLLANTERARDLERGIVGGERGAVLSERLRMVGTSCRDCHVRYRDRKN